MVESWEWDGGRENQDLEPPRAIVVTHGGKGDSSKQAILPATLNIFQEKNFIVVRNRIKELSTSS